ncbi:hypothetical protein FACS189496_3120 [Bacilli bacterium]|nr:hypothetical protein FACS189496_3120 [Bacilli bacterium]
MNNKFKRNIRIIGAAVIGASTTVPIMTACSTDKIFDISSIEFNTDQLELFFEANDVSNVSQDEINSLSRDNQLINFIKQQINIYIPN